MILLKYKQKSYCGFVFNKNFHSFSIKNIKIFFLLFEIYYEKYQNGNNMFIRHLVLNYLSKEIYIDDILRTKTIYLQYSLA